MSIPRASARSLGERKCTSLRVVRSRKSWVCGRGRREERHESALGGTEARRGRREALARFDRRLRRPSRRLGRARHGRTLPVRTTSTGINLPKIIPRGRSRFRQADRRSPPHAQELLHHRRPRPHLPGVLRAVPRPDQPDRRADQGDVRLHADAAQPDRAAQARLPGDGDRQRATRRVFRKEILPRVQGQPQAAAGRLSPAGAADPRRSSATPASRSSPSRASRPTT